MPQHSRKACIGRRPGNRERSGVARLGYRMSQRRPIAARITASEAFVREFGWAGLLAAGGNGDRCHGMPDWVDDGGIDRVAIATEVDAEATTRRGELDLGAEGRAAFDGDQKGEGFVVIHGYRGDDRSGLALDPEDKMVSGA